MIDRLVCADGGTPDPSSTHGKQPAEARALAGIEGSGCSPSNWLGVVDAGSKSGLDRHIGGISLQCFEAGGVRLVIPEQAEVRNVTRAVSQAADDDKAGKLFQSGKALQPPRPKVDCSALQSFDATGDKP